MELLEKFFTVGLDVGEEEREDCCVTTLHYMRVA